MRPGALLCALAALALLAPPAAAHKYHTSFAEADYNPAEQSLQITLRTFPDDLEKILSRRAGRPVTLDDKQAAARATFAYLQEVFQLKDAGGAPLPLTWVGMEAGVDNVRLYFETKLPAGLPGTQLRDAWLSDLYDDQINLVNVKDRTRQYALTFKRGAGFQPIPAR
ncbi:MAG TPA: DUF6702 family protein [Pyrinomonadaceae bacterium]